MLTNTTIPRPGDWDLGFLRAHPINPWLKRQNMRLFRRIIAADTKAEVNDATGDPHPLKLLLDTRPSRQHEVESLEIDEGNREAWDEGNPDLRVIVHSPNSVTCEDDMEEWSRYESDWDMVRERRVKPLYYRSRRVPTVRGFRYDPATGEEISYG